ncbi:MAG: nucleoside-diphosphate sugar epimerase/dehydratase [bacterium]|nr:nucleoside-diphosphate sugar epimerase/dehydratase [bacterium]
MKQRIKNIIHDFRKPLIVLLHLGFIIFAYAFSFYLRFDFTLHKAIYFPIILRTLPLLIFIKMSIFFYYGLFGGLWRYLSIDDLWQIIKANTFSTILFTLGVLFYHSFTGYPRSVIIIDWFICTAFVSGVRFISRYYREKYKPAYLQKTKRSLVIGAGQAGILILKECRNNPNTGYEVVGFIDDDKLKVGQKIYGVKVLGYSKDIPRLVEQYNIEELILAIPSAKGEAVRKILHYCEIKGINIKIVPKFDQIIKGNLELKPRQVRPEDLLGREVVRINETEINSYVKNKRVLVAGAGGSIGSELCRQIVRFTPKEVILFDHNENDVYFLVVEFKTKYPAVNFKTIIGDIKDIGLLKHTFSKYQPQVIFHAAAHKHVPLMEENPPAAVKNNIVGTRNLIYAADHYKVERFVLISTDKAVHPTSVMGATKRIAEMVLQSKAKVSRTKYIAVRFGNVLGSDGSVVPLFKKQIDDGGPITITHPEARRYFMSIPEAAQLVIQAGALGNGGEIFILDMGEQIKIVDIARDLITLSGLSIDKDIAIKYIGLRPGEKLYEEILLDAEKDKVTKHNKIYITQPKEFDAGKLRRKIKELERLAELMDGDKIKEKIKDLVPTYKNTD